MNRILKLASLLLAALILCSYSHKFDWASLASNQLVNGSNLQNAVDNGLFTLKAGQTITKTTKVVLRSEANTWLNIEPLSNDGRGVRKSELIAADIVIDDFDFMVLRFSWDYPSAGYDLDIQVQYENNSTSGVDNVYVGYGNTYPTVPAMASPQTDSYLWWGLDDTNSSAGPVGIEGVLIGLNKFKADYPASPNIIEVGLYAVWYMSAGTGNFTVEAVTYKGGTMSKVGTNIINTGGTLVSSDSRSTNTLVQNKLHLPASSFKVGTLRYNKTTNKASLNIF